MKVTVYKTARRTEYTVVVEQEIIEDTTGYFLEHIDRSNFNVFGRLTIHSDGERIWWWEHCGKELKKEIRSMINDYIKKEVVDA